MFPEYIPKKRRICKHLGVQFIEGLQRQPMDGAGVRKVSGMGQDAAAESLKDRIDQFLRLVVISHLPYRTVQIP